MIQMTIGRLAHEAGVGVETIRFYERKGLIRQPARRSGGYREYSEDAVARVRFIKRSQALGFTLNEIQELLELRDDPEADRMDVRERAAAKIEQVEAKIQDLQRMKTVLQSLMKTCHGTGPAADCPIIQALS
jgi:Hg(II)-responsive transcriptional regulator